MASPDPLTFKLDLVQKMAQRLQTACRRLIESKTLRNSLAIRIDPSLEPVTAFLVIPQYWAVYYHDGRGPVRPVNGKYLVYFHNIQDDPRVAGGRNYPVRSGEIKRLRLDPEEFRRLVREGKLLVKKSVGPVQGKKFFERLGPAAPALVSALAQREFRAHLKAVLGPLLHIRGTARIGIG